MSILLTNRSKNGAEIIIRHANSNDAKDLLSMKKEYLHNCDTIPLFSDEYKNSLEDEEILISRLGQEDNSCLLIAESDGLLVGNIDLNGNQRRKLKHTAMIGMGILESWRNQGIGHMLISAALEFAIENKFLKIIWLEVYDSNIGAKKLYQKNGFEECGRMQGFFLEHGKKIDNVRMMRTLES